MHCSTLQSFLDADPTADVAIKFILKVLEVSVLALLVVAYPRQLLGNGSIAPAVAEIWGYSWWCRLLAFTARVQVAAIKRTFAREISSMLVSPDSAALIVHIITVMMLMTQFTLVSVQLIERMDPWVVNWSMLHLFGEPGISSESVKSVSRSWLFYGVVFGIMGHLKECDDMLQLGGVQAWVALQIRGALSRSYRALCWADEPWGASGRCKRTLRAYNQYT